MGSLKLHYTHDEHFVRALSKYVHIDVYGSGDCASDGEIPQSLSNQVVGKIQKRKAFPGCPNDSRENPDVPCTRSILGEYKFYLALENSACADYITEKFFDTAFQNNAVPIVLGGSWYEPFVPEKIYRVSFQQVILNHPRNLRIT